MRKAVLARGSERKEKAASFLPPTPDSWKTGRETSEKEEEEEEDDDKTGAMNGRSGNQSS